MPPVFTKNAFGMFNICEFDLTGQSPHRTFIPLEIRCHPIPLPAAGCGAGRRLTAVFVPLEIADAVCVLFLTGFGSRTLTGFTAAANTLEFPTKNE